jgi:protein-L-isoaspartate(D-aspartate) O-methyltransferase
MSITDAALTTLQHNLVEGMKQNGALHDQQVEAAFRVVPRHLFLPHLPPEQAYRDQAIATKKIAGEWVSSSSQPAMMALMLQQLDLKPGQHILEIGAGTGYNAALMAALVGPTGRVTTVDIDDDIVAAARANLASAGYHNVEVVLGDGALGYEQNGPYDRVILTVGADDILPAWVEQLKPEGVLVLPLAIYGLQKSVAFVHQGDHLASVSLFDCGFMRLRGPFAAVPEPQALPHWPQVLFEAPDQPAVDLQALEQSLTGEYSDHQFAVEASFGQLFSALPFWFAFHGYLPGSFQIVANENEEVQAPPALVVPSAYGVSSMQSLHWSDGLLIWFVPESDETDPGIQWSRRFPLAARVFGLSAPGMEELAELLAEWQTEARQFNKRLLLQVYPKGVEPPLAQGAIRISKTWTNIMFSLRSTTDDH